MGSACCVAAKDRTITSGPSCEIVQRNARYSPSWSFRWDNRGRVAGDDTPVNWLSDGVSRSNGLDSFRTFAWQKSPPSERNSDKMAVLPPDPLTSTSPPEVKELAESPVGSHPSPTKLSPSVQSASSLSTSPRSCQNRLHHSTSTPPMWARRSPVHRHLYRQVSETRISEEASPYVLPPPSWSNESFRGSIGNSSDRWSFDSEFFGLPRDKISRSSGRNSCSAPLDNQICGVCSKLITEKSSWDSQKIMANNELAVVAVLICGHIYHAECLECMTPELNKYDPDCPVCTLGQKQMAKLTEKILRAEIEMKAKHKKSDLNGDLVVIERQKSAPKISTSSSSMKGGSFLRRHLSLGSRGGSKSSMEKKGFFWAKSRKD